MPPKTKPPKKNTAQQIVHFIRHAEGTHNEAARKFGEGAYKDWAWEVGCDGRCVRIVGGPLLCM